MATAGLGGEGDEWVAESKAEEGQEDAMRDDERFMAAKVAYKCNLIYVHRERERERRKLGIWGINLQGREQGRKVIQKEI